MKGTEAVRAVKGIYVKGKSKKKDCQIYGGMIESDVRWVDVNEEDVEDL